MDHMINTVRHYSWGSITAIPELAGVEPDGNPQAEQWMGAHPTAPSMVRRQGELRPLDQVIQERAADELGEPVLRRFGPRLPFLLKLLAAEAPLSVQVHPDLAGAAAGHKRENAQGIPLDAPHRNYPDGNHKPEMIVALDSFEGLCGFRAASDCAGLLRALHIDLMDQYCATLGSAPQETALRQVFAAFLAEGPSLVETVTRAVAREARKAGPYQAAFAGYDSIAQAHPGDPGLLPALMLNYFRLAPGEGLFLGAGVPHAYIRGLGVEVMAASDNVLRCGLTSKHVDSQELLRVIAFSAAPVHAQRPISTTTGEGVFATPVDDFRLSVVQPGPQRGAVRLDSFAPQILLCTAGTVSVTSPEGELALPVGNSVYTPAGEPVTVTGSGTVYRATVDVSFP
ncbi:mannose-6-phosphate isomerase, class I [Streptomyces sp. BE230]|uniref:mannose-6-phosphate isomerase, class I n=1 Tax=Streptomyces sp. BE230 TaxID=3002526 RepID=UPI002ED01E30|nr:mannose-6-phosphate isomerase, class I [Streptomyces sp. BE230]